MHNQTLLEIFSLRSSQQLVSTNLLRSSSRRDAIFVRRHIIFNAESQNGQMTEWSFWPDTAVKKYCPVFPFKVACARRHLYFHFARGNRRSFFSYGSIARPAPTWRNSDCALSKIVYRVTFRRFWNMGCFAGSICFRVAGWQTSCDEACFGLSKSGCARAIFDLYLI